VSCFQPTNGFSPHVLMDKVKVGTGSVYELTHDVRRNPSLKLEHRNGLPSEVVQDMDLTTPLSSNFCIVWIPIYLVIPAADS